MVWLKRIGWGFGGLLTLGMIVIAIILIPAHLQIRDVEPEMPTQVELLALLEEPEKPISISYFLTAQQMNAGRKMGHSTFVIEWEDGRILLIDAGMDFETATEFSKLGEIFFGSDPGTPLVTAAGYLGDDIERVRGIGFSHLHIDHVQGIELICAAASQGILALQTDLQASEHNFNTSAQAEMIEQSACLTQLVLPEGQHSTPEFPGIGIYPLAGHTPGSTLFAIPVGDKLWLLSGDITNSRADMVENRPKGFFYRNFMVPEHSERQGELRVLLKQFDDLPQVSTIVSHDGDALEASGMQYWKAPSE